SDLFARQRRPTTGDNVFNPRAVERDHIEISLANDDEFPRADGLSGKVVAKESARFVVCGSFWRVEVLRHAVAKRSATKGDGCSTLVANWKEQAMPKSITSALSVCLSQTRINELLQRRLFTSQIADERVPLRAAFGRKTDTKALCQ